MAEPEKKKAELKITGMHCATCAVNIEESLAKVKDVEKAQVNFGTDSAHVVFDPAKVSLHAIEKAVKDAGYDVVNQEVTIKVGGMMCATCVQHVEEALKEVPGVANANVNLASEKATVV